MSDSSQPLQSSSVPERLNDLPPIFISHSGADDALGQQLAGDLRKMGHDTWYDRSQGRASGLVAGDPWWERIQLELTQRPVFLVLLSPTAMASKWVRDEVSMAWQQKNSATGKVIIPVLYQPTDVPPALTTIQFVSFEGQRPYEQAFAELLTAIRLGKTRENEIAQLPLLAYGPPFEDGLLPVPEPFVGREEDLAWVLSQLRSGQTTSITPIAALRGTGGIGKTTLAAKAVQVLRKEGRFRDGIAVLLCQGLTDPLEVLRQILSHFDMQRRLPDKRLTFGELATLAHTLLDGKDALIVLDNVEPEWPIEDVVKVLRATGVTLLLTARQMLPSKVVPAQASRRLNLLDDDEAFQLFLGALGRELQTPQEAAAVEQILIALGRHTLAVKLAGAYASIGRDLEALAVTLARDPLQLPDEDSAAHAERAVELVFTHSLGYLSDEEQRFFAALAAFALPEMGRKAALALARALGLANPEYSLDRLVRLALIDAGVLAALPVESDRERLRLHLLLWALARRRFGALSEKQKYQANEAIARYYATYAHGMDDLILGFDEVNIGGALAWAERAHATELIDALRVILAASESESNWDLQELDLPFPMSESDAASVEGFLRGIGHTPDEPDNWPTTVPPHISMIPAGSEQFVPDQELKIVSYHNEGLTYTRPLRSWVAQEAAQAAQASQQVAPEETAWLASYAQRSPGADASSRSNNTNQESADIAVGTRLTDYGAFDLTIEGMASGGMGMVVWGPNAARGGKIYAAKLLRPNLLAASRSPEQRQRLQADFEHEALIWCHLWPHPYLITANGLTRLPGWNGTPALMLEYAPQGSLRRWLVEGHQPGKALRWQTALAWAQQIAAALVAIHTPDPEHERPDPLVHCDLKPENILILGNGWANLTDFGITRMLGSAASSVSTATADLSPSFEQADGEQTAKIVPARPTPDEPATIGKQREQEERATRIARMRAILVATGAVPAKPGDLTADNSSSPERAGITQDEYASRRTTSVPAIGSRGAVAGTRPYMPPEQWVGLGEVTPATDVYALGVILFELFAGVSGLWPHAEPLGNSDFTAWYESHRRGPVRRLSTPEVRALSNGPLGGLAEDQGDAVAGRTLEQLDRLIDMCLVQQAEQRPTAAQVQRTLAAIAAELGEAPQAVPVILDLTRANEAKFWSNLAVTYGHIGQQEERLRLLQRAVDLDPANPRNWINLGSALDGLRHCDEALAAYNEAEKRLAREQSSREDRLVMALANGQGNTLRHLGRYREAVAAYERCLAARPEKADTLFNLAITYGQWVQTDLGSAAPPPGSVLAERLRCGLAAVRRVLALTPANTRAQRKERALEALLRQVEGQP